MRGEALVAAEEWADLGQQRRPSAALRQRPDAQAPAEVWRLDAHLVCAGACGRAHTA